MPKKVVLLDRPLRKPFDSTVKSAVEGLLKDKLKNIPIPVRARWHQSEPILRLETKFVSWDVAFGPGNLVVTAVLSALGRFLDTKKARREALATIQDLADDVGV